MLEEQCSGHALLLCCRWAPPFASATCSEFCVSIHAYQVKLPSRGGSACAFQAGIELSRHCLESPCSRAEIESIELNKPVPGGAGTPATEVAEFADKDINEGQPVLREAAPAGSDAKDAVGGSAEDPAEVFQRSDGAAVPEELQTWQDNLLDTSAQVPLGADGMASATIELKDAVDLWHVRIAFTSAAGQTKAGTSSIASFEFLLSVMDDAGDEIHTWQTSVPPSPASQSVWEAMNLRLYRAKTIRLKAAQPFRVAELQMFGMPLPQCPPGGFLGPASCSVPTVQRLRSHNSLDCQGAWSEWTACQADCRRKRQATERFLGFKISLFSFPPCRSS